MNIFTLITSTTYLGMKPAELLKSRK